MQSLTPTYIDSIALGADHLSTIRAIGEAKGRQIRLAALAPEALASLRTRAEIESTESSNRLEGIVVDRHRLRLLVEGSTSPRDRSEQEIAGYRDALALVHEAWESLVIDLDLIRRLHRMVYSRLPEAGGDWKQRDNTIIDRFQDGSVRVRFHPVPAVDTPLAMERLVERYQLALIDRCDPLLLIPLTILDFLCIHPFMDGNGRVARLLTLLLLYQAGYSVGRYVSLERVIEQSREGYYRTLESSSQDWFAGEHDPLPWLTYFWGVLIAAYKEVETISGTITRLRGSKGEQIILAIDRQPIPFAISTIERECPGISRTSIRRVLRKLRDAGRLAATGVGRGAKWVKTPEYHLPEDT